MGGGNPTLFSGVPPFLGVYSLAPRGLAIFGTACNGLVTPRIGAIGHPEAGGTLTINLSQVPAGSFALLVVGTSNTAWGPWPLPYPLGAIGLPVCELLVSPDVCVPVFTEPLGATLARSAVVAVLPGSPVLTGLQAYCQWIVALPAGGAAPYALSRGVAVTFF